MSTTRRRLLVHLADEGLMEHRGGRVTSILAEVLGCDTASRVGVLLRQLERDGLVLVNRNRVSGRVFGVRLTAEGRAEVGRDGHVHRVIPRRETRVATPMPLPGPLRTVPFDPEQARERSLGGAA